MPIRDNAEARELLKSINEHILRKNINQWLLEKTGGRPQEDLSSRDMDAIFLAVDPLVKAEFGIDIWDAMMVLNVAKLDSNTDEFDGFDDWSYVYDEVYGLTKKLNISPHLQDDFSETCEFHIWCSPKDFSLLSSAIADANLQTKSAFLIIVNEVQNNLPTGKSTQITIGN